MTARTALLLLAVLSCAICLLQAGTNAKTMTATRIFVPPKIDGYGDDKAWTKVPWYGGFLQREPVEGANPTEKTEIKVVYDNEAIYFFLMMYDSEPAKIVRRLARRDNVVESDIISIRIDSYHDHQTGAEFTINASGSKIDILQYDDGTKDDDSWDPVWEVQSRVVSNGWCAEVKIPFRILRYDTDNSTWGINILRRISRKNEYDYWALIPRSANGFISQFGHLNGLEHLPSPQHFEALPYMVASGTFQPQTSSKTQQKEFRPNAGLDAKYGLTSNFTIDLTANPDFGQVEADPEVLNLTTIETFYPEKRPFFVEGTQILRFTTLGDDFGPGLFYSRRIGAAINVQPPSGSIITDDPRAATILGAAKVTGKTRNGFSLGVLEALTQKETYSYRDSLGSSTTAIAEPLTNYSLIRMKQDVWNNSNVGMIVTSVARNAGLPAYTGGGDWNLKFNNSKYAVSGFLAGSHIYDPVTRERKEGTAGKLRIGKDGGEPWLWVIRGDFTSRKYDINDIGYFLRPNDRGITGDLEYVDYVPGKIIRTYYVGYDHQLRWNFDGAATIREGHARAVFQLLNYYILKFDFGFDSPAYDDRESRGYGLYRTPQRYFSRIGFETDQRGSIVAALDENYVYDFAGQKTYDTQASMTIRPTTAMEFQVKLGYTLTRNMEGYVNLADPQNIFGHRDVDQTDVTLRGSLVFSHNLTLQIYNQLFFAKRQYYNFSYLDSTSNLIPTVYFGDKASNRTAMHTNVVLRWEYLPGSTMYLVWTHGRNFSENGGYNRSFSNELDQIFTTAPDNVFMLKISYWYSM
jgi:hypothetical protein